MTNGEKIRNTIQNMTDRELAKSIFLDCDQCVYAPFGTGTDCIKLGLDCTYGKIRWLEQEARKI